MFMMTLFSSAPVIADRLAKAHPVSAQLALDLQAMQTHRNIQLLQKILAEKHAMTVLHVQHLNGEHVGRPQQLFVRENHRRGIFLVHPPLGDVVQFFEVRHARPAPSRHRTFTSECPL